MTQIHSASSVHVLAFSSHGGLLVVESEGSFSIDVWEEVVERARYICHGAGTAAGDIDDGSMSLEEVMRNAMQERMVKEQRWRESFG